MASYSYNELGWNKEAHNKRRSTGGRKRVVEWFINNNTTVDAKNARNI